MCAQSGAISQRKSGSLDNHLESYQQWLARGVIAENADTTKWRNVMYDIKQKRGLGVINFDFGASKRLPPEESIYTKDSTASIAMLPMRISMPLVARYGYVYPAVLYRSAYRYFATFQPLPRRPSQWTSATSQ